MSISPASPLAAAPARRIDPVRLLGQFAPVIFLIVLVLFFTSRNERFLLPLNLWNIMRQVSITGLIAIGMTFVILTAGIDLSVGSLLALSGLICADIYKGGAFFTRLTGLDVSGLGGNVALAAAIAVLIGVIGGLLQGVSITRLGVPAFVVTLGGLSVFRGAALQYSNGGPISTFDPAYNFWGQGKVFGDVPVPVILFLAFALLAHIILRYTRYGRHVYAVGGNPEAARLSGLPVRRLILSVYIIVGFFAGLGGFVLSSRLNSSEAVAGIGYELTVIASVVIGGTSLFGGRGSVLGTVIGSVLIGVLNNGLVLMNVSSYIQQIVIGVIIVLAVAFDQFIKAQQKR
ncbi:MAG: ABC transporter permease [Chloroflexota bacterium]|nr:ABC transporter permease [Chloroflexota bacterium]